METKQKSEKKSWKIIKIVLNVVFYVFIAFLVIFSISNFGVKDNLDIPGILGNGFLTVETDSMDGEEEDSFTRDDLIFVKKVTDSNREKMISKIEVGDIVTFSYYVDGLGIILNTHRVVDIKESISGEVIFITQGDKVALTPAYDYVPGGTNDSTKYETVGESEVLAVYTGQWDNAGKTMKYVRSENGFLLVVVIPTAIFLVFEAFVLVTNIMKIKQDKLSQDIAKEHEEELEKAKKELEAEKEKIRAELLAEMESKKNEKQE
ncbi:MAG: hypothetical protein PHO86_03505 [Bacilli bacterium]|nr:hypothetical protein [Bacilli bacterium]